jgi:hypothetical protein
VSRVVPFASFAEVEMGVDSARVLGSFQVLFPDACDVGCGVVARGVAWVVEQGDCGPFVLLGDRPEAGLGNGRVAASLPGPG